MVWNPLESAPTSNGAKFLVFARPLAPKQVKVFEAHRFADDCGNEIRIPSLYGTPAERDVLSRLCGWMEMPEDA